MSDSPTIQPYTSTLKSIFGYSQFRGYQEAVIKNILQNKNTFVSMPTGAGKSLCYQLPAIVQEGLAIVITPLIAIMKDQVDQLQSHGIKAVLLNASLPQKVINTTRKAILEGDVKLLYIAPESLLKEENLSLLKQIKLSFIAVDEAHCISDWGHDFRPEYRNIHRAAHELGDIPIIALTATASPRVRLDILQNLGIPEAAVFESSFNRPNLYYEVRFKEEQADKQLIKIIKQYKQLMGIVYCQSRKKVDELTDSLNLNNIPAVAYHAGLDNHKRVENQEAFFKKECQVIVATIAFGMGIDTIDVQFVIHYDLPKSIESYYQETGRGGRDNLESTCLLLYNQEDFTRLDALTKSKTLQEREKAKLLLEEMRGYILSGVCRRKQLLFYFGEEFVAPCNYCDNCQTPTGLYDVTEDLTLLLETILKTNQQLDMEQLGQFIQGIYVQRVADQEATVNNSIYFGKGRHKSESFWKSVIRQALINGYLIKDIVANCNLTITSLGRDFLKNKYTVNFAQDKVYQPIIDNQKNMIPNKIYEKALFNTLYKLREKIAKEKGIPAYTVLQDSSLEELAAVLPTTLEELAQISGMSMGKAAKFGPPFIQAIKKYVNDNDISTSSNIVIKSKANRSKDKVYIIQQIDRKTNLEEIAMAKSQTMDELLDEIETICYSGVKLDLSYYIDTILTKEQQEEMHNYFMQAKQDNIKLAYKVLGKDYNEEDIRLMRISFFSEVAN